MGPKLTRPIFFSFFAIKVLMNLQKREVSPEVVEAFLNGHNPKKYVVGIEGGYHEPFVYLVVNEPNSDKRIEKHAFEPFIWFKEEVSHLLYEGKRLKQIEATKKWNVKIKKLTISDANGNIPDRLATGYKFIAQCKKSYNDLINFFREGGIDIFSKEYSKMFFAFSPIEQFMIQTGIRLFKGMDDYNDLHRFQYDLETEGLDARVNAIFQIGMRDNKGVEHVLETIGDTAQQKRDCERENLIKFFRVIDFLKPDTITGYNSESFDWPFIIARCERLGLDITQICLGLNGKPSFKRKPATLKLGNETEAFQQTYIYGHNVIDIAHAVRRAQAINSDIKKWNLKYITQYSKIAKKNRVYIPGNLIHTTWSDKVNKYAYNDLNGDWYKITDRMPLRESYSEVTGSYIVQRYLLDDLWETEQVDLIFNQAAFLIAKLLPTNFGRATTMGTASQWKLIMAAWSYENQLAIPATEEKRDFTGGLSRLLRVGFSENVEKEDFAALYPKTELTHDIFPKLDISGVMKGLLTYIVDTRDKFKFLKEDEEAIIEEIDAKIKELKKNNGSKEEIENLQEERKKHNFLKGNYDKKQLPLKILANSWFGAYGAPYIFNWGDTDCAEETTCRGRQYLRLMVKFFKGYGFEPLVLDTDGVNFEVPKDIENVKYLVKGTHWKTKKDAGKELCGTAAVLAEFNETYMIGRMGLDTDAVYTSTINFARKNYANNKNGKVKLVGNSIKSKKMPVYIEEFINKSIKILLEGKGKEFIDLYYEYVDKIYNFNIPLVKIASKSKIKSTLNEYKKRVKGKNKAGKPMPRQAHMELVIKEDLHINLGDVIYYVNTGKAKSHGDLKTIHNEDGSIELNFNCKLIEPGIVEGDLEIIGEIESLKKMIDVLDKSEVEKIKALEDEIADKQSQLSTEEYNVAKYLDAFNKKVKPLLVCFHTDIRDQIMLKIVKDKKTKMEKLQERNYFTEGQCQLVSGMAYKEEDQDTYEDLMTMEDKEIKFWDKVNKVPNNMEVEEWERIRTDYHIRKAKEREEGILNEKQTLDDIFKRLEYMDIRKIESTMTLPIEIITIATIDSNGNFVSRKWNTELCPIDDIFKYENEINERDKWYQENGLSMAKDKYQKWVDHKIHVEFMEGNQPETSETNGIEKERTLTNVIPEIQERMEKQEEKIYMKIATKEEEENEDEEENDEEIIVDDFLPEFLQIDLNVELNDARERININEEPQQYQIDRLKSKVEPIPEEKKKIVIPERILKPKMTLDEDGWNF
jgi:DNA polymerase elongation subunit (family B)